MIAPDIETAVAELRALVQAATVVLPFTGAGISTECGIPDFRSPGGVWTRNRPIPFDEFLASSEMRAESWRRRFAMEREFAAAKPGRGHLALASLHQCSGISAEHVIELHGNTTYATCLSCGKRYELPWVKQQFTAAGGEAP